MNLILAFALIFNFVGCYNISDFAFVRFRDYPKVTPSGKDELTIDFEILVDRDIQTTEFHETIDDHFYFSILPPLSLKFEREVSGLERVDVEDVTRWTPPKPRPVFLEGALTENIGKCEKEYLFFSFGKADQKFIKHIGAHNATSLKSEISALSIKETLVADFSNNSSKLERGTYKWSGLFKKRDEIKSIGVEYFDEFVLAVGIKGSKDDKKPDGMFCVTKNPIASAIMLKHFETQKFKSVICSYFPGYDINGHRLEGEFRSELELSSSLTYKSLKKSVELSVKFKLKDENHLDWVDSPSLYLDIDLPRNFIGTKFDYYKICKPESDPTILITTCKYYPDKAQISYGLTRSVLQLKKDITLKIDIPSDSPNAFLSPPDGSEISARIIAEKHSKPDQIADIDFDGELKKATPYRVLAIERCIFYVKKLFADSIKLLSNRTYLVASGSTKLVMDKLLTIFYDFKTFDDIMLMKLFVSNNTALLDKDVSIDITGGDDKNKKFVLPDESDYVSHPDVPVNKNVISIQNMISIKFHVSKELSYKGTDSFYELTLAFKRPDKDFVSFNRKDFLKFKISGRHVPELPIRAFPLSNSLLIAGGTDQKTYNQSDTFVTGPRIKETDTYTKFYFYIDTPAVKKLLVHFQFSPVLMGTFFDMEFDAFVSNQALFSLIHSSFVQYEIEPLSDNPRINGNFIITVKHALNQKPEFGDITVSLVSDYETDGEFLDYESEKNKVFQQKISVVDLARETEELNICLTKGTRFASSMFRSGENANYIFARFVDCKRPWHPSGITGNPDDINLLVDGTRKPSVKEILTMAEQNHNLFRRKLMKMKRFYEHYVYLFLDDMALKTLRDQMIAGGLCKKGDGFCKDNEFRPLLEKLVQDLFTGDEYEIITKVVGYFDGSKHLHMLSFGQETKLAEGEIPKFEADSTRLAFEHFLDQAIVNAQPEKMGSSFSVIALLDSSEVMKMKRDLHKYEPAKILNFNNGLKSYPVYVDIIPVDKDSKLEIVEDFNGCKHIEITDDRLIPFNEISTKNELEDKPSTVFTSLNFKKPLKPIKPFELMGPEPKLKGADTVSEVTFKRDDVTFFYGISHKLDKTCFRKFEGNKLPIMDRLTKSLRYAMSTMKSYFLISTCVPFGHAHKIPHKYKLLFKEKTLGEYEITAKEDIAEKTYGECDIFSLYKYLPHVPHYTPTSKDYSLTIPDKIISTETKKGVQIIKGDTDHTK